MQKFIDDTETVYKFIHDDRSETAIKFVSSCDTVVNPVSGKLEHNNVERNKVSIFISASAGCPLSCKFCHLTLKDMKYGKLKQEQIEANIREAVEDIKDKLQGKYVKLCWMGMGEAVLDHETLCYTTMNIMSWLMSEKIVAGLDGVDVATVLPKLKDPELLVDYLEILNEYLEVFPLNPNNRAVVHMEENSNFPVQYEDRSLVRLFYSLHSVNQETRNLIIPNAMPLEEATKVLKKFKNIDVIFHHMFLDGINDKVTDLIMLSSFMKNLFPDNELRILRYNGCGFELEESEKFEEIIGLLVANKMKMKVQISTGREILAACGQFITDN